MSSSRTVFYVIYIVVIFLNKFKENRSQLFSSKKYETDLERIEDSEGFNNFAGPWRLKASISRLSRTEKALNMNFTLPIPFDNLFKSTIEFQKWSGGTWKSNFLIMKAEKSCRDFKTILGAPYAQMWKGVGLKNPSECPYPSVS